MEIPISRFFLLACVFAASSACAAWSWQPPGGSRAGAVSLALAEPGEAVSVADGIPVTGGHDVALSFDYAASGLTDGAPLELSVRWFNAAGEDLDTVRLGLGFPPLAHTWLFARDGHTAIRVSDNLSVPREAAKARFTLRITRVAGKEAPAGATRVDASNFDLHEGGMPVTGIELPETGPADAGPLSKPPDGVKFGANLAPNGDLEEGDVLPAGWKIEGNNVNGSVEWSKGGAFSGRHAFVVYDRGPYVKSWDRQPGDPVIPGGTPNGNAAGAREEASARWVSEPVPAKPGTAYQASAFYWYGNHTFLDRGLINPVSIQFLDAKMTPLPQSRLWDDWFADARVITRSGWVPAPGKPVVAPSQAAFLRAVVKMPHAMVSGSRASPLEIPGGHRMILVDNISVCALPDGAGVLSPDDAFAAAAAAGMLPFVPSSLQHRPDSILVSARTDEPGGLIIRPYDQTKPNELHLELTNLLGDIRQPRLAYEIAGFDGKTALQGEAGVDIPSFGKASVALEIPSSLPYGPWLVRYGISEPGSTNSIRGEARFGIMPPRQTSIAERGRMDYPFSLWMPFPLLEQPDRAAVLGSLAANAGVGKTWFGAGVIYLEHFVKVTDPAARQALIDRQIVECRAFIAFWKKYNIISMGHMEPPQLMDPSLYPVLTDVVKSFVTALKGDIHFWRYGTESIHGGVHELDRATMDGINNWGGHDYLYWGRKGTVRQYWAEYFVAFKAAKEADPKCFFSPNSASDIEGSVLHTFFQVMNGKDLDGFGMNTYISAYSIWPPNEAELRRNGVPDLPIYVSEFGGIAASPVKVDHLDEELAASRHEVDYWSSVLHSFPNFFHLEQWGMILGNDDGSLTCEEQVRPLYLAYANMTNVYGAGKFIARYDLPGISMYVRQRSVRSGCVAMIESTGEDRPIDLDAGAHPVVFDLWGNRTEPSPSDGVLTIQASPDPVYVVSDQEIHPQMGVRITVDPAISGLRHHRITVTLENITGQPAPGRLELIQNGPLQISGRVREVLVFDPGQKLSFVFDVRPAEGMPGGKYPIKVRFTAGLRTWELPAGLSYRVP